MRSSLTKVGFEIESMQTRALVAGILWTQSRQIRESGKADIHALASPAGKLFALVESTMLAFNWAVGEEIVCVARKPAHTR
jgi:hypothetical protein